MADRGHPKFQEAMKHKARRMGLPSPKGAAGASILGAKPAVPAKGNAPLPPDDSLQGATFGGGSSPGMDSDGDGY